MPPDDAKPFRPSDEMRRRRPELFSDTKKGSEPIVSEALLNFHLQTITERNDHGLFEHFCRRLAEKLICPNLKTQTGPVGGGDSKVDSENYPVSENISERWYTADSSKSGSERWAFAFSAKQDWKPKVKSDVKKIANTNRGYKRIYFMSNQAIKDKERAETEDELAKKWNVSIVILDRLWIVAKTIEHHHWDLLPILNFDVQKKTISQAGPNDVERAQALKELDGLIADSDRYQNAAYQLAEDCLQTAILARGLEHPRKEIEERFDRAERIARVNGSESQVYKILYQRAWTANGWFDDINEMDRLYEILEPLGLKSALVWDLDLLQNLCQIGFGQMLSDSTGKSEGRWSERWHRLKEAFTRHANDQTRPTSSLWANTQLLFMELMLAVKLEQPVTDLFAKLKTILVAAKGHLDYPFEIVITLVQLYGQFAGKDAQYRKTLELAIELQGERSANLARGLMRLESSFQNLDAKQTYQAIKEAGKAQIHLAQNENIDDFIRSLALASAGYEQAGLLWAMRGNLIVALDLTLREAHRQGPIAPIAITLASQLAWVEIRLGRVPCMLIWFEMVSLFLSNLELSQERAESQMEQCQDMDMVLANLILKTPFVLWSQLERLPALLEKMYLLMSRAAALFMLGQEELVKSDYDLTQMNVDDYFLRLLDQPANESVPALPEWHSSTAIVMTTVLLGCQISVTTENKLTDILLAESILAYLEAFLSTSITSGRFAIKPFLAIEIKKGKTKNLPFETISLEDDHGETSLIVTSTLSELSMFTRQANFTDAMLELICRVIVELQLTSVANALEELIGQERAIERAQWAAQMPFALCDFLAYPKYFLEDWLDASITQSYDRLRTDPWTPAVLKGRKNQDPLIESPSIEELRQQWQSEKLRHNDATIVSCINIPLWERAGWSGVGFALRPYLSDIPELMLLFTEEEAATKIFRGWRKTIGESDVNDWISLTFITGIDRRNPHHYRLAIGVSKDALSQEKKVVFTATRSKDMKPDTGTNLANFFKLHESAGGFLLVPGIMGGEDSVPRNRYDLAISKQRFRIVPAWKIGRNDPACVALKGITDPIVPNGVKSPPYLEVRKQFADLDD